MKAMISKSLKTFIYLSIVVFHSSVIAQVVQSAATCPAGIPQTTNKDDFSALSNGEVLHIPTNLIFMRCSIGQTWINDTCEGEPQPFTWQMALQQSLTAEYNNTNAWRLPNLKELSVITERACVRPAINDEIFPNTSPDDYWTSTPAMLNHQSAWSVSFTNGSHSMRMKQRSLFIRLVRTNIDENIVQ